MLRDTGCLLPVFVLSIPDDGCGSEDQITTLYPESGESGLFLLSKDGECRAILYRILREEQKELVAKLQEWVTQVQARGSMYRSQNRASGTKVSATLEHLQLQ